MTKHLQISSIKKFTGDGPHSDSTSASLNRSARRALEYTISELYPCKIALVSSFGSASVVLLHMVSEIKPDLPVLFINTGKLFPETLSYRDLLAERFGLSNIRSIMPEATALNETDPEGSLWQSSPDACCELRKSAPLAQALLPYSAWISGRKRYQNGQRQQLNVFEQDGDKVKINPLAHWTARDVQDYIALNGLPVHPLIAKGYPSIGCMPCTSKVKAGEDERAGRWRGRTKTECGIHFTTNTPTRGDTRGDAHGNTFGSASDLVARDTARRSKSWA